MKPDTRSWYLESVQRTIDYIFGHLDEALDLHALASGAHLSPFHFHRIFKGMVGETPLELIRRLRMERAAWRLSRSNQSITDIAFGAGYETHEGFTRAFRAYYGTSPSGFKRRKHPRIEIAAKCGVHFTPEPGGSLFNPRDPGGNTMNVEIVEMPGMRLAAVPHVGPYNQIPLAFERLGEIAGSAGLLRQPDAAMLAMYHDDPESTPEQELRSHAAIVVPEEVPLPAGLVEQRLPAGRYAHTLHVGPYEQLGDAWARFMGEWLPASGHRIGDGVSYEIYLNTPAEVPKEELRTEMYIPID
jgi:AraC family transcriptional regulator